MDENTIGTKLIEATLAYESKQMGLRVERQVPVSLNSKGIHFDEGFRAD